MNIRYPIYLTRLLSSLVVGILILAIIKVEFLLYHTLSIDFHFQKNIIGEHLISLPEKIKINAETLFYLLPLCFFIGELFSGIAEYFIFDSMYLNVRTESNTRILEYSDVNLNWCVILILCFAPLVLKFISSKIKVADPIYMYKFNRFIEKQDKNFSLSEMYFNMHRILGGCSVLFFTLYLLFGFSLFGSKCGRLVDIYFMVFNILLMIFCVFQAKNHRKFANKLIYFSQQ